MIAIVPVDVNVNVKTISDREPAGERSRSHELLVGMKRKKEGEKKEKEGGKKRDERGRRMLRQRDGVPDRVRVRVRVAAALTHSDSDSDSDSGVLLFESERL